MSAKIKTGALWAKNKDDLKKQLGELKTELGQLRVQKIAGGSASKLTKMCVTILPTRLLPTTDAI
jgi:large subunit ribosomal protein L35e